MVRYVSAIGLLVLLTPASLLAQSVQFTVTADSAGVHRSPSTGSPLLGHAPRGTVLTVMRELGSWVRISWPGAADGVGYVHMSVGKIARPAPAAQPSNDQTPIPARPLAGAQPAPAAQPSSAPSPLPAARVEPVRTSNPAAAARTSYVAAPSHALGFGGRVGVAQQVGFGATARMWSRRQIGVQLEVDRESITSVAGPDRVTSLQFAPSVLYSPRTQVRDYVSMRPYVGGGGSLYRQTLSGVPPVAASASSKTFGLQGFGGIETTFASLPQFALSADVGYRWLRTPMAGFDPSGVGVTLSGHWYVK